MYSFKLFSNPYFFGLKHEANPMSGVVTIFFVLLAFLFAYLRKNLINKKTAFIDKAKIQIMDLFCSCFDDLKRVENISEKTRDLLFRSNLPSLNGSFFKDGFDDVFRGSYNGVCFEIAEERIIRRNKKSKDEYEITTSGVVSLVIPVVKNFKAPVVVLPSNYFGPLLAYGYNRTNLEDVKFAKKYNVYAKDEVEARYLVTTAFMERIVNLNIGGFDCVACSFLENHLVIALYDFNNPKNFFEPITIDKPADDYTVFSEMIMQIISIFELIDYFKLNEKTGL